MKNLIRSSKEAGKGLTISYGFHPTPFGECLIALTGRGICGLIFVDKGGRKDALSRFRQSWKKADIKQDQTETKSTVDKIFKSPASAKLFCRGTDFQVKVWEALLKIKPGKVATYKDIAQKIGNPKAVRAVGTAIGRNAIAYLIPCHRVIRGTGHLGGYRWGLGRKRAMLALESQSL